MYISSPFSIQCISVVDWVSVIYSSPFSIQCISVVDWVSVIYSSPFSMNGCNRPRNGLYGVIIVVVMD